MCREGCIRGEAVEGGNIQVTKRIESSLSQMRKEEQGMRSTTYIYTITINQTDLSSFFHGLQFRFRMVGVDGK